LTPTIFAIDTAGERCSLALSCDAHVHTLEGQTGHTHLEQVLPMIERLFTAASLRPEHCDAFAYGSGPGSFTGLRVACTISQGLALATDRPVIALGKLLLLAAAAPLDDMRLQRGVRRCRVLAAADARMQQAYWGVYDSSDGIWLETAAPSLCEASALGQFVSIWQPDCCVGEALWLRRHLDDAVIPVRDAAVQGTVMAQLACEKFLRGELLPAEQALPAYVRDRVALTVDERRARLPGAQP